MPLVIVMVTPPKMIAPSVFWVSGISVSRSPMVVFELALARCGGRRRDRRTVQPPFKKILRFEWVLKKNSQSDLFFR